MGLYSNRRFIANWTVILLLVNLSNETSNLFTDVVPTNPITIQFIRDIMKASGEVTQHRPSENSIMKYDLDKEENERNFFQKWKAIGSDLIRYGKYKLQSIDGIERIQEDSLGCKSKPSLRILKYLGRICEDCYSLYRDADVFQMCRYK